MTKQSRVQEINLAILDYELFPCVIQRILIPYPNQNKLKKYVFVKGK